MTRKAGVPRCLVCGHPTSEQLPGASEAPPEKQSPVKPCGRGHGAPRSLHGKSSVTSGLGLWPADLVEGVTEVVRTVFTIVLGRRFFGTLRTAVIVNCLAFLAFVALFGLVLLPAFAADERHETARWGVAAWLLLTPTTLELLAGSAQNRLRLLTEQIILGERTSPPPKTATARAGHRFAALVLSLVVLLTGLALVELPWVGLPLILLLGSGLGAYVWFDATLARAAYDLPERARLIWRNRWRALGVGLGLALCSAVPFLNLLLLPTVAAVATTSAFVRFDKRTASLPGSP